MGKSAAAPQPDHEGEERVLALVIGQLDGLPLDPDAHEMLSQRAHDAFRQFEASEGARLLELEENSRKLGEEIRFAFNNTVPKEKSISTTVVTTAFVKLCPGFWPFC